MFLNYFYRLNKNKIMNYQISVFRSEVAERFDTAAELKHAIENTPDVFEDFSEEEYLKLKSFLKSRDYVPEEEMPDEIIYKNQHRSGVQAVLRRNALHFISGSEGMQKYEVLDASGEATLESDNLDRFDFQEDEWFV
jgi:hypothetical protein